MGLVAPRHVGSSQTRARTRVPCIGRRILNHCTTREAPPPPFKSELFPCLPSSYLAFLFLLEYVNPISTIRYTVFSSHITPLLTLSCHSLLSLSISSTESPLLVPQSRGLQIFLVKSQILKNLGLCRLRGSILSTLSNCFHGKLMIFFTFKTVKNIFSSWVI